MTSVSNLVALGGRGQTLQIGGKKEEGSPEMGATYIFPPRFPLPSWPLHLLL